MYAYRGELTLFDCKSEDAFEDGIEMAKSKPEPEPDPFYLHQHVNDLAASERELHEPQHVLVDQVDDVQFEPLHDPDDKEHGVNDLIALIPAYVIDLQLLPQPIDQGGGDVHHDIAEHQVCEVDRM